MNTALQIIGDKVTTPVAWEEIKSDALMAATLIESVNDPVSHDHAVAVQCDIRSARKFLEASRKELKDPIFQLGKRIDAAAKAEDVELEKEEMRVQSLVNDFQTLELAKARAAENARRLEEERIDGERKVELEREIARQQAIGQAPDLEALDAIQEKFNTASAALPVVEMHRAEGQRVTENWEIQVSDIWMLARAHPSCVKMEPLVSEIKKLLDLGVKVHGVTATKKVCSTTTTRRAIDI